jgi:O-antigen/teichoic acid export membrane protein
MQQVKDTVNGLRSVLTTQKGWRGFFKVSLYRNAIYLISANLINSLLGFVFWIVAARYYTEEQVGLGSAAISSVMLLSNIANLGLGFGIIRFLPKSSNPSRTINAMLTLSALASIITTIVFISGMGIWSPSLIFIRKNLIYIILFSVFVVMFTTSVVVENVFVAVRRSGFTVTKNLISSLIKIIAAILLAKISSTFGVVSSWGIAGLVALLVCLIWLVPIEIKSYKPSPVIDPKVIRETMRFSAGNWIGSLLWTAPSQVLSLMVIHQLGAVANAYFYVAYMRASMLFVIPTMASTSLFAEGSHEEKAIKRHVQHSFKLSFAILIPAVVTVMIVAKFLLLPFGPGYAEGASLLRLMAASALPLAVNIIYLGIKRVEMSIGTVITISGVIAILILGLGGVLVPRMGINGVGLAWLTGQSIIAGFVIFYQLVKTGKRKTGQLSS